MASFGEPASFASSPPARAATFPLARHPELPVRARRLQFSASQLSTYEECPRKWFFRYVCAAVDEQTSGAATYGTAFHAALEDFHAEVIRPHEVPEDVMRNRLAGALNAAFERFGGLFPSRLEAELSRRRALRTARHYVTWLVERARKSPFEVVACEHEVHLDVEGFAFIGFIDRIDRDLVSGNVTLIDYKTGNIAEDAATYRAKIAEGKDFQLPFYYWAQSAAGERVASIALVPLKDDRAPIVPLELDVVFGDAPAARARVKDRTGVVSVNVLERARSRMIELCRRIALAPSERFLAATDPQACTYCSYRVSCRERPPAAESKWAH